MIPSKSLGLMGRKVKALVPIERPSKGRKKWNREVVMLKAKMFLVVMFKEEKVRDKEKASILRAMPTKRMGRKLVKIKTS